MSRISKLSKLSNISRIGTSTSSALRRAFWFDWTNDYISSNATIGRTGYDMNVSGNVSTGSDADGSYIQFNGSYRRDLTTWSNAKIWGTSYSISQAGSFSCSCSFKVVSFAVDNNTSWLFWISSVCSIYMTNNSWWAIFRIRNWASFVDVNMSTLSIWTLYKCHLVYDAPSTRMYCYVDWVLQNTWGSLVSFSFSGSGWSLWDDWVWWWNHTSSNKYIYHAAIRNKALTQAEIDADIALWNTAKNDPSIVAYYIPDNLTYNTQYMSNPKDLDNAIWTKSAWATVTANTTVAPDWTTTADTVSISWASWISVYQTNTSISWATIASKTFIVKAFVKCSAWTQTFRLECSQAWVASSKSADLTATTTRQEFTFSQAFTSSASWTWVTGAIVNSSTATNPTLEVRNVRLFLVNETLRDESPNIWWFIWWKTPLVMSAWVKPDIDSSNNSTKQVLFNMPRHYLQLRNTNNWLYFRSETTLTARAAPLWWSAILGTWFRGKAHILWVKYRDWTWRLYKAYVNWVQTTWSQTAYSDTIRPASTIYRTNASVWFYTTDYRDGNIRDIRAYTFTGSFTDADALAIYNGGEPTSSWVTKYLHYRPPVWEVGTTTQDQSTNDRDWTLNGWVTRPFI